jgi:hypothetical protein
LGSSALAVIFVALSFETKLLTLDVVRRERERERERENWSIHVQEAIEGFDLGHGKVGFREVREENLAGLGLAEPVLHR